jgi:methionyl-tRNA formyltransferase
LAIVSEFLDKGELTAVPQDHSRASFSLWRDEFDYEIDWSQNADYIKRFVDAVGQPYDGAYSFIGQKKVRVLDGFPVPDRTVYDRVAHIGKLIQVKDGYPIIVCGSGLFAITNLVDEKGANLLPLKKFRVRFGQK